MSLSRGMQGLSVRIARALNRIMQRRGRVFDDHYHSRVLPSPTELVDAIAYVLGNHEHLYGPSRDIDAYSSLACHRARVLAEPRTWLIRVGWRRAHLRSPWLKHWVALRDPELASHGNHVSKGPNFGPLFAKGFDARVTESLRT